MRSHFTLSLGFRPFVYNIQAVNVSCPPGDAVVMSDAPVVLMCVKLMTKCVENSL